MPSSLFSIPLTLPRYQGTWPNLNLRALVALALLLPSWALAGDAFPGGVYPWQPPEGAEQITFRNRPVMRLNGQALVGIPLAQPLGPATIAFQLNGEAQLHEFQVADKAYTEQHITLANKEMVNPNPQQLERIRDESALQRALYLRFSPAKQLEKKFITPLDGLTTSLFGHRRFFNGQARNPHSGLDIAAPTGTPIIAPASGRVMLADSLYYNGKAIFLDHGQGLVTMFCHLSEHSVSEGELVQQGQEIGLVGATGRVTGPHLHYSVSLNGYRVDPTVFQQVYASIAGTSD